MLQTFLAYSSSSISLRGGGGPYVAMSSTMTWLHGVVSCTCFDYNQFCIIHESYVGKFFTWILSVVNLAIIPILYSFPLNRRGIKYKVTPTNQLQS